METLEFGNTKQERKAQKYVNVTAAEAVQTFCMADSAADLCREVWAFCLSVRDELIKQQDECPINRDTVTYMTIAAVWTAGRIQGMAEAAPGTDAENPLYHVGSDHSTRGFQRET